MAERLLEHWSRERGLGLEIRSCGTAAESWYEVPEHAKRLLAAEGVPAFKHGPQLLTRDHLRWADLVLVMARHHRDRVGDLYPEFVGKTRLFRELAGYGELDVDDPMGGSEEVFARCLAVLKESLEALAGRGFAPAPKAEAVVSVIVGAGGRAALLPRTLASVRAQTYHNVEVIEEAVGSPAAARNRGAGRARGELLAFLAAGDEWLPGKLAAETAAMAALPADVALGYSSAMRVRTDGNVQFLEAPVLEADEPYAARRALALGASGIRLEAGLLRAAAFRALGGFDESCRGAEDFELVLRLAKEYRVQHIPGHFTRLHDDARAPRDPAEMEMAHRAAIARHAPDLLLTVVRSGDANPADWARLLLAYARRLKA